MSEWPAKFGRFPITVDASGDHGGLHAALRSTAPDGTCTSVAIYFEPTTPLPLLEMYTRGCTLHTGRCHARALIPEVLALVADGRLDPRAGDERGRRLRRRGVGAGGAADQAHSPPLSTSVSLTANASGCPA